MSRLGYPTPEPMMMKMGCSTLLRRLKQYTDWEKKNPKSGCPLMK